MLQLRVFGDVSTLDDLGTWLTSSGRGEHAVFTPAQHQVHTGLLTADIDGEAAQDVLAHLDAIGVQPPDIALLRVDNIGPAVPGSRAASLIWPDMVGLPRRN